MEPQSINCMLLVSDTVYLYDSLFSEEISPRVELRIAVVMTTSERAMEVLIVHSHQQTSSVDCGLFSIVNAMVFAMQRKILSTTFDVSKLRSLWLECINKRAIICFPNLSQQEVAEADMDMLEVEVHCLCLLSAMNFIISNAWN